MHDADDAAALQENRELRKSQTLWAWGLASWLVAAIVFCTWTTPLGISNADDADLSFGNLAMAALAGAFAYAMLFGAAFAHERDGVIGKRKLLAVGAVIPAACVVIGLGLHSRHVQWERGLSAFAAYTGHFPRNGLGHAYVESDRSSVVTVCAKQIQAQRVTIAVSLKVNDGLVLDGAPGMNLAKPLASACRWWSSGPFDLNAGFG
jgi:hypothetical protein